MSGSRPFTIFAILFNILAFAACLIINFTASGQLGADWDLFKNDTGAISDLYHTQVTPIGSTFIIWAFIYVYQALWIIYSLTLLCRKSANGYLYYSPNFMPLWFYLTYIVNNAFNITWLFLWDRQYMIVALVFIALLALTLVLCMGISMYSLNRCSKALIQQDHALEIRLVRGLVHNGLGMYAAWVTVATHVNLAVVLVYEVDLSDKTGSSIALGILTFFVVLWFILDNFVLDKFTRYLFTPYVVVIWALIGVIRENWDTSEIPSILTAVLLSLVGVATIVKIALVIIRSCRNPEPAIELSTENRAQKHVV